MTNKRVLIIPDTPHWALDKNARDLVKYNQSNLDLEICYFDEYKQNWMSYHRDFNLIFPMYKGLFFNVLKAHIPVDKVITGIRSFYRWDHGKTVPPGYNAKPSRKIVHRLRKALLVNTHCKKLWYIFSRYFPIIHTKYTCDLEMFYPERKPRANDKLIVGWAGSLTNHPNKRGFHEFIKPACESVPGVELKVQTKEDNFITDDNQMRAFYNSLDLYITASRCEGTPRPVIEAAACGVPILSTDVGIVPELVENEVNGFIIDRTLAAFTERLKWITDNRDILPQMGQSIHRKMEQEFNWKQLIFQWTDFFNFAIELYQLKGQGHIR
ncbi:glycosyltransferase family 4 protein [candidate division KSB1 bacterium]|nr:glycosyltransferase family 4 protein [candidate division KSB1 bacterium]